MRSCFYRINKNILGYFHNFLVSRYSIRRPIYNTDQFLKLILTFTEAKYRKTSSESIRLKRFIFFFGDTFILMFGEFVCFCNIDFLEYEKRNEFPFHIISHLLDGWCGCFFDNDGCSTGWRCGQWRIKR